MSAIKVGKRHRNDLGDLAPLAESLGSVGLLHAVVIDAHDRLMAGRRRLAAAKLLGWREVPVRVVDLDHIAMDDFMENTCRKDFTPSEVAAIAKALRPVEEKRAHQRRTAGLQRGRRLPVA
jgi:ParB/RepB/Spo0J family partition protein